MRVAGIHLGIGQKSFNPSLTAALLHFDGADGSTVFTDSSPSPLAYSRSYSNNFIRIEQSQFGGSSLYVGGDSGSGVRSASDNRFLLGSSDFTKECWFYDSVLSAGNSGICGISNSHGIVINNGVVKASVYTGSYQEIVHQNTVFAASWNHVALVRLGATITLYVNGVPSTTTINIGATSLVNIGSNVLYAATGSYQGATIGCFNGYIDELRLRREAMYNGDFTTPTAPFTG